jgi:hypothetical protein
LCKSNQQSGDRATYAYHFHEIPFLVVSPVSGFVRSSNDLDLWEISIVTFPLLSGARVRAVKDLAAGRDERLFRRHPRLSFTRARTEREGAKVGAA